MEDLVEEDGENQAVRCFLGAYQCNPNTTVLSMKRHLQESGFDGLWPSWTDEPVNQGHLTKSGAQSWLRYLFALEGKTSF
jgi:hypothetical protein